MPHQKHSSPEDADLVRLFQIDPDRALGLIFERFYNEVCGHIYRIIPLREATEDIAQSIFLELWQKRKSLDIQTSVGAYLHKMARTRTLNYIRDNKRYQYSSDDEARGMPSVGIGPLQTLMMSELESVVNGAIDGLPERCRLVFILSRFEGMSYKEIAETLDISTKTVENQISKALQLLREALSGYDRGIDGK